MYIYFLFQLMIVLDPWNILSWKNYIFKHLKCISKLKKVENTTCTNVYIYMYMLAIAGQAAGLCLRILKGTNIFYIRFFTKIPRTKLVKS